MASDEAISAMKRDVTSAAYVPMRIREIVQDTLSSINWETSVQEDGGLSKEHVLLRKELEQAEDLLKQSREDCQDISAKYVAVSEKVRHILVTKLVCLFY